MKRNTYHFITFFAINLKVSLMKSLCPHFSFIGFYNFPIKFFIG